MACEQPFGRVREADPWTDQETDQTSNVFSLLNFFKGLIPMEQVSREKSDASYPSDES